MPAVGHAGLLQAVEHAADGVVITDCQGIIQFVNPAFTSMTGYRSEEAVGQNPRVLKSGFQSDAFYADLWNTVCSGRVWVGSVTNRRKNGTFYDEEMRIAPIRESNGDNTGFIAIKRDTTERRAHEKSQALLAAIVESSEDAIFATTAAGDIVTWNRGASLLFGYSSNEVVGKNVSMLMAPGRLGDIEYFTGQITRGIKVSQYESLCLRKNGSLINICVSGAPIRNSTGELVAMCAVLRDISERKRAECALRESEERFRIMADGCPAVMWTTDAVGELQFINRAYRESFGTTCEELEGGKCQ